MNQIVVHEKPGESCPIGGAVVIRDISRIFAKFFWVYWLVLLSTRSALLPATGTDDRVSTALASREKEGIPTAKFISRKFAKW